MKQQAFNTCPLAMGQPGNAAATQQPAGLENFARGPLRSQGQPRIGKRQPKLPQCFCTWVRRKDASLAAAPGALGARSLGEEK